MNTKQIKRAASGIAAAAVMAAAIAAPVSAAVPTASSNGSTYGSYAGNGWAGFQLTYNYADSSTLSKLYLEIDIAGGQAVPLFDVKRNGTAVRGCAVSATVITCEFKTVRNPDAFVVTIGVQPTSTAAEVRLSGGWSSTGYVTGGNNSHGDAWELCQAGSAGCADNTAPVLNQLVSSRVSDADQAAGFGNTSLQTASNFGGNSQAAKLLNLPAFKYATINDNAGPDGGGFSIIDLSVNNGAAATFQLVITYPKGTQAPKGYIHVSSIGTQSYVQCAGNKPGTECFTYDKKTYTATLYLLHNGTVRRTY